MDIRSLSLHIKAMRPKDTPSRMFRSLDTRRTEANHKATIHQRLLRGRKALPGRAIRHSKLNAVRHRKLSGV
jgi:hypothetical protein